MTSVEVSNNMSKRNTRSVVKNIIAIAFSLIFLASEKPSLVTTVDKPDDF